MKQTPKFIQFLRAKDWANLWYYYKIHILVFVLLLPIVISLAVDVANNLKPKLEVVHINVPLQIQLDIHTQAVLTQAANDPDGNHMEVSMEDHVLNETVDYDMVTATVQRIAVQIAAGEVDILVCDYETFLRYTQEDCFTDLSDLLDAEDFSGQLYRVTPEDSSRSEEITGLLFTEPESGAVYALAVPFSSEKQEIAAAVIADYIQKRG